MNTVNYEKLEKDFTKRIQEEARTMKCDEIRFRTMTDPITYDEYSELIKGAHLKSIHKHERAEINKRYKQTVVYTDYSDKDGNKPVDARVRK